MTYEEHTNAAAKYRKACEAYRGMKIGDAEYLAARAEWEANQKAFDESRGESS